MIRRKRLLAIIVVSLIVVAALVAGVYALIQRKKSLIPEQVPAVTTEEVVTQQTDPETGSDHTDKTESETEKKPDEVIESSGLKYSLNDDGNSYTLVGIGTCTDRDVIVPETYKNKPVTAIGDGAFAGVTIETVTLSNTVKSIGSKVFVGCNNLEIFFNGTKKEWIEITKANDWKEQCSLRVWPREDQEENWEIPIN